MDTPLRLATPADAQTVLMFIQDYYAYDQIPFDEVAIGSGLQQLLGDGSLGRVWLVQHGGQDVGYAIVTFAFDLEFGGREAFITDLFIAKDYRRKGLGRRTLEVIERFCKDLGLKALELQVQGRNHTARHFYLEAGYEEYSRIVMSKLL